MKVKVMMTVFWIIVAAVVGVQAYVRLAPSRAEDWVIDDTSNAPGDYPSAGGFMAVRDVEGDGSAFAREFEQTVLALPRTRKLGRSDGQDVYVSRSKLWGFPDYITFALTPGETPAQTRAVIYSRLRFGQSDMGVNQKRVKQILTGIGDKR